MAVVFQLHVVHIREDVSDVTEAKTTPDGLAVLAFFVKVGSEIFNCPSQIPASSLGEGLFMSIFYVYVRYSSPRIKPPYLLQAFCLH